MSQEFVQTELEVLAEVQGVSVAHGGKAVVNDASLLIHRGEIGCLLGPSGCGKSTLLRAIAGFERPLTGTITMNGKVMSTPDHVVNPEKRGIGMVFQDFALFPHLTIAENIAFGLRGWGKARQSWRVSELLELIDLSGFEKRHPHSLSGGEQQRIALARAMAPKPQLLLLDEAFSNLDVELRQVLRPQVREILRAENLSAILVTHDQEEAFAMADQMGVMEGGRIHQWGSPFEIYHQPGTRFIAGFVGEGEFVRATAIDDQHLETVLGTHCMSDSYRFKAGDRVEVLVRPDDILLDDESSFSGEILKKSFRGSHFLYQVKLVDGQSVLCFADSHHDHEIGERIGLHTNMEHVVIFKANDAH